MDHAELERVVDRALRQLPEPAAPRTLAPRIMRAIAVSSRHAPAPQAWRAWSPLWRALAAAAVLALAAAGAIAWPMARAWWGTAAVTQDVRNALAATDVLWRVVVQPFAIYIVVLVAVMCAACAAGAAALRQLALGGITRS